MRFGAALIACAVLGGVSGGMTSVDKAFDAAAWRAAGREDSTRTGMVDDLVRSGRLRGLTEAEVTALLGPPPEVSYFHEWDMVYLLGPCRCLFPIDNEWLVIRLDEGRVSQARVVQD